MNYKMVIDGKVVFDEAFSSVMYKLATDGLEDVKEPEVSLELSLGKLVSVNILERETRIDMNMSLSEMDLLMTMADMALPGIRGMMSSMIPTGITGNAVIDYENGRLTINERGYDGYIILPFGLSNIPSFTEVSFEELVNSIDGQNKAFGTSFDINEN